MFCQEKNIKNINILSICINTDTYMMIKKQKENQTSQAQTGSQKNSAELNPKTDSPKRSPMVYIEPQERYECF